jgi:tyrosinase
VATPRIRQDIWSLETSGSDAPWDPITLAYARAVGVMKQNLPTQPLSWSWRYQTEIHGMGQNPGDGFRHQCQHRSWFFLPWHRMYLFHFESTLRAIIRGFKDINDDVKENWALPYWNYEPPAARTLPPAFLETTLPGTNEPNPLYDANRLDWVNDGSVELTDDEASSSGGNSQAHFSTNVRAPSFGGREVGWNHLDEVPGATPGLLESTPHGDVHGYVGGDMGGFATAGNDPVFWLHHANIDRLWEVWRNLTRATRPGEANPANSAWLNQRFSFRDSAGSTVTMTPADVLDTKSQLEYEYEDDGVPPGLQPPISRGRQAMTPEPVGDPPELTPDVIGSSPEAVTLERGSRTVAFDLEQPHGLVSRAGRAGPARILLTVEHISSDNVPDVGYGVFLEPAEGDPSQARYVGSLPLFGLAESMADDAEHQLRFTFDVTDAVDALREIDQWNAGRVQVTFRPINEAADARAAEADRAAGRPTPQVTIGTVSISYQ